MPIAELIFEVLLIKTELRRNRIQVEANQRSNKGMELGWRGLL